MYITIIQVFSSLITTFYLNVQYDFTDRIISQFEEEGLMLSHMKMIDLDTETAEEIYKNKVPISPF